MWWWIAGIYVLIGFFTMWMHLASIVGPVTNWRGVFITGIAWPFFIVWLYSEWRQSR